VYRSGISRRENDDAADEILRPVSWVIVEEVGSGDWSIAGNGLTTAGVHALQRQAQPVTAWAS
jgi:hypothetical protein